MNSTSTRKTHSSRASSFDEATNVQAGLLWQREHKKEERTMLRTRFSERFGIDAPVVVAPMGPDLTGPELVAAVCNAGGFGILQAQLCSPDSLRSHIRHLRSLTARPFGVNFLLPFPHRDGVR